MNVVNRNKNLKNQKKNPESLVKQDGKPQVGKAIVVGR